MERSDILTFQMPLPNSGAVATAGIPGCVQILFTDLDRGPEKTLEHKMSWSFASVTDCDSSLGLQAEDGTDLSEIRTDMIAAGMTEVGEAAKNAEQCVQFALYTPAH